MLETFAVLRAIRIIGFSLGALMLLVVGCIGAQLLWHATHHQYDSPSTGAYYGVVNASFDSSLSDDVFYFVHFRGQTRPGWRWSRPTNFTYENLVLEWHGDFSPGKVTVNLPSLTYHSSTGTGTLTSTILAHWLLAGTNHLTLTNTLVTSADLQRMETILGYITAAGNGTLPPPRHHSYTIDQPIRARVQHFLCGPGVGFPVYIWLVLWLLLVLLLGRRWFPRAQHPA